MYNFSSITMNITQGCNLRCKYCQVHKNAQVMPDWIMKKSLEWVTENVKGPYISFFGGEPTTQFDKMKWCVENFPNIRYGVSTNVTLLDSEKIKFMFDHNFGLLVSIDGVGDVHNITRDNSWDKVKNKLPIIGELFPNAIFRITVTADNVSHLLETVIYAASIGFTNIEALPDGMSENWKEEDYVELKRQINAIYSDSLLRQYFRVFEHYRYRLMGVQPEAQCCNARTSMSILPDGRFSLCGEQTDNSLFIIGSIFFGIDEEKVQNFRSLYIPCAHPCAAFEICDKERCFSRRFFCNGDLSTPIENHCRWYQIITEVISDGEI